MIKRSELLGLLQAYLADAKHGQLLGQKETGLPSPAQAFALLNDLDEFGMHSNIVEMDDVYTNLEYRRAR